MRTFILVSLLASALSFAAPVSISLNTTGGFVTGAGWNAGHPQAANLDFVEGYGPKFVLINTSQYFTYSPGCSAYVASCDPSFNWNQVAPMIVHDWVTGPIPQSQPDPIRLDYNVLVTFNLAFVSSDPAPVTVYPYCVAFSQGVCVQYDYTYRAAVNTVFTLTGTESWTTPDGVDVQVTILPSFVGGVGVFGTGLSGFPAHQVLDSSLNLTLLASPEPSTFALLGLGIAVISLRQRLFR